MIVYNLGARSVHGVSGSHHFYSEVGTFNWYMYMFLLFQSHNDDLKMAQRSEIVAAISGTECVHH